MNRRLSFASALSAVSQAASVMIALWSTPRLVHGLGNEAFALYAAVGTFASYFAWLELGLGAAYMRSLTSSLAMRQHALAQRQVETAHALYTNIAAVGFIVLLLLGTPYALAMAPGTSFRADAVGSLLVLAAAFAASMSLSTSRAVIFAMQRADLYARASLLISPLVPLLQVWVVVNAPSMTAVFAIQAVANVGVDVYLFFVARQLAPQLSFRRRFDHGTWDGWKAFSLAKFGTQVATQFQFSADRLLLGFLVPLAQVAPYAVSASIAARVRGIENALCTPFFAAASAQNATNGPTAVFGLLNRFAASLSILMMVGLAVTVEAASPFLRLWMGPDFAASGSTSMIFLVAATVSGTLLMLLTQAFEAVGRATTSLKLTLLTLAVSLTAAPLLTSIIGPTGTSVAFAAGPLCGVGAGWVLLAREAPTHARGFLVHVLVWPILAGILTSVGGTLLSVGARSYGILVTNEWLHSGTTAMASLLPLAIAYRRMRRPSPSTDGN